MEQATFTFTTKDNKKIFAYKWGAKTRPIAAVQIAHGMAEHSERYSAFANYLVKRGFVVYANDHRGHHRTAGSVEKLGFFANEDGWFKVVGDMKQLTDIILDENPELPIFIFGHSMGSLLTRTYLTKFKNNINGVIFSGTSNESGLLLTMGKFVAKVIGIFYDKKTPSNFLDKMSFGKFNSYFKPNRTKFDWLSRDKKQVDNYITDMYCGAVFSNGFFYDLAFGMKYLNKNLDKISKDLPILIISGTSCPVGDFGKGIEKLYKKYKKAGIINVKSKLYTDARHEIINETNKGEVYQDIVDWIRQNINN